jgi:riboflavin synthase
MGGGAVNKLPADLPGPPIHLVLPKEVRAPYDKYMFTGLVEELAAVERIEKAEPRSPDSPLRISIKAPLVSLDAKIGDSIAVNGCCLTVIKQSKGVLTFEAGRETLRVTSLGRLKAGSPVNLERSLQLGDRLGGHLVTGHVDSLATVLKRRDEGEWATLVFRVPARIASQLADKGSVAVDGVSLTVVKAEADRFSVALIPHTLSHTTIGGLAVGDVVNIETDLLAKYVARQLESRVAPARPPARSYGERRSNS